MRKMCCDFLVAGGGYAGICAAIQAGRLGLLTILVEKEMLLGGNGGPNLGVGAHATMACNPYWNETGIIEEIEERINYQRARMFPTNFGYNISPKWDAVVSEMLQEAGVIILRRHLVFDTEVSEGNITNVSVLNIENLDKINIEVRGFVLDATGDAFVADLSGAKWRMGRESQKETGERCAPDEKDDIVSTASITALVVDTGRPCTFTPPRGTPPWNPEKPDNHFNPSQKVHFLWQVDEGGENENNHPLYTPQDLYKRLTMRIFSVWNYLKNIKFPKEAENFELVWISPILGRRESRRIEGDYLLTQTDIETCKAFKDAIGFGGSYLDEHMPSYDGGYEVRYYTRPLPYDIPLRCLYSANVKNLFSGGRAIGVSHLAFTSTRLMRTGGLLGQAAAIAAKICKEKGITPRQLANDMPQILQQELVKNDVFIIGVTGYDSADVAKTASVTASSEAILSMAPGNGYMKRAGSGIGAAIYDYPKSIEKFSFYVKNSGKKAVHVKGIIGYGQTSAIKLYHVPEFEYNEQAGRYEEINKDHGMPGKTEKTNGIPSPTGSQGWSEYYERMDFVTDFSKLEEIDDVVEPGFEGWKVFDLKGKYMMPDFDRSLSGQAMILAIEGDVEVMLQGNMVDVTEGIIHVYESWKTQTDEIPVFAIFPEYIPGRADNVINGKIHREGRAKLNQWMSNPLQALPQWIELEFSREEEINEIMLRFDVTERLWTEMYNIKGERAAGRLVRDYSIEVHRGGVWMDIVNEKDNFLRFRQHRLNKPTKADRIRLNVKRAWNESQPARVYEIRVY